MVILFLIIGFVIGSILNVFIYQIPRSRSVFDMQILCKHCGERISILDLIPAFYIFSSKGGCKKCGEVIYNKYFLVEILSSLVFVLSYIKYGLSLEGIFIMSLMSLLVTMIFIDLDHHIIPNRINLLIGLLGITYGIYTGLNWQLMLLGFLLGGTIIIIVSFFGPMGGGDIKLFAALGLWFGPIYIFFTIVFTFLIGAIAGFFILIFKIRDKKDHIAFGPFIGISAALMALFGDEIVIWYFYNFFL